MTTPGIYFRTEPAEMRRTVEECILYCRRAGLTEPTAQDLDRAYANQEEAYSGKKLPDQMEHAYYQILRSDALSPYAKRIFPHGTSTEFRNETQSAMIDLLAARGSANAVRQVKIDIDEMINEPNNLLFFRWKHSLFDGAGTPASLGFIDDDYFPPWDTWLTVVPDPQSQGDDCLVSWVPSWARALVESAIAASPTDCLSWGTWEPHGIRTEWENAEPTTPIKEILAGLLGRLFRRQ